jgi:cytochrome c biogenesis protein CcdA
MKVSGSGLSGALNYARRRDEIEFSDNPAMYRLIGVVVSIGLADSLNPSTIAPALYLASGRHGLRRVAQFTAGVFGVYMIAGAAVALGPGELVLDLVPHPHHVARHIVECVASVIMLTISVLVWRNRDRLSRRAATTPSRPADDRASVLLGATITAVELPTAFPYFAAIATIVGSGYSAGTELLLILLFNVCFVLPLLAMIATLWLADDRATEILAGWREYLRRRWPALLAGAMLFAGVVTLFVGVSGLLVAGHGDINNLARHLRHLLHLSSRP